jgi:hypothetical protein
VGGTTIRFKTINLLIICLVLLGTLERRLSQTPEEPNFGKLEDPNFGRVAVLVNNKLQPLVF